MHTAHLGTLLLASVLMPATVAAQPAAAPIDTPFVFRAGQVAYVTAFHTIEHYVSYGLQSRPPG